MLFICDSPESCHTAAVVYNIVPRIHDEHSTSRSTSMIAEFLRIFLTEGFSRNPGLSRYPGLFCLSAVCEDAAVSVSKSS